MFKYLILLCFSLSSFAQETTRSTEQTSEKVESVSTTVPTETISTESVKEEKTESLTEEAPAEEEVTVIEEPLDPFKFLLGKFLAKHPVSDPTTVLWSLESNYRLVKNNDFEYQKQKPLKEKEVKDFLEESKKDSTIDVSIFVKLGNYDFKKESFPIESFIKRDSMLMLTSETDLTKSPITYRGLDSDNTLFKNKISNSIDLKISNLKNFKELKISKSDAEKLTAEFGLSRSIRCTLTVGDFTFKSGVKMFGKTVGYYTNESSANVKKSECFLESDQKVIGHL